MSLRPLVVGGHRCSPQHAAKSRLKRMERLPMPAVWRSKVGEAAGNASDVYGAAYGSPAPHKVTALRAAASKAAVCRGSRRWAS